MRAKRFLCVFLMLSLLLSGSCAHAGKMTDWVAGLFRTKIEKMDIVQEWNGLNPVHPITGSGRRKSEQRSSISGFYKGILYGELAAHIQTAQGRDGLSPKGLLFSASEYFSPDTAIVEVLAWRDDRMEVEITNSMGFKWSASNEAPVQESDFREVYWFSVAYPDQDRSYKLAVQIAQNRDGTGFMESIMLEENVPEGQDADALNNGNAESTVPLGTMYVVKCNEWVSLFSEPSKQSVRITKVPLNAAVDCETWNDQFLRCTYNGKTGYILREYLDSTPEYFKDIYDRAVRMYSTKTKTANEASTPKKNGSSSGNVSASVNKGSSSSSAAQNKTQPSVKSSVEQSFAASNFFSRYPDYVSFGDGYAVGSQVVSLSMGDYLFSAGAWEYRVVKCESYVSLRAEAGSGYARIAKVPKGTRLYSCGICNGWMLCSYNGRYGWIDEDYLRSMDDPDDNFEWVDDYEQDYEFNDDYDYEDDYTYEEDYDYEDDYTYVEPSVSIDDYSCSIRFTDYRYSWEPLTFQYSVSGPSGETVQVNYTIVCSDANGEHLKSGSLGSFSGGSTSGSKTVSISDVEEGIGEADIDIYVNIVMDGTEYTMDMDSIHTGI